MRYNYLVGALEALLFASGEPVSISELAAALQLEKPQIWEMLSLLKEKYNAENSGLVLREIAGGVQLAAKPCYYDVITKFGKSKEIKLSNASLEVLAIAAAKQPVTRSEIEAVRGIKSDKVLNTLLELGLLEEAGRKKALGSPILYVTTQKFLAVFGLNSLKDLPDFNSEEKFASENFTGTVKSDDK